jgi:hypothetical protein
LSRGGYPLSLIGLARGISATLADVVLPGGPVACVAPLMLIGISRLAGQPNSGYFDQHQHVGRLFLSIIFFIFPVVNLQPIGITKKGIRLNDWSIGCINSYTKLIYYL